MLHKIEDMGSDEDRPGQEHPLDNKPTSELTVPEREDRLRRIKQFLARKEMSNAEHRAAKASELSSQKMDDLLDKFGLGMHRTNIGSCVVQINEAHVTRHIANYNGPQNHRLNRRGQSHDHCTMKDLRKVCLRWSYGCRAKYYAESVFPHFLNQINQFCIKTGEICFPMEPIKQKEFCKLTLISIIDELSHCQLVMDKYAKQSDFFIGNSIARPQWGLPAVLAKYIGEDGSDIKNLGDIQKKYKVAVQQQFMRVAALVGVSAHANLVDISLMSSNRAAVAMPSNGSSALSGGSALPPSLSTKTELVCDYSTSSSTTHSAASFSDQHSTAGDSVTGSVQSKNPSQLLAELSDMISTVVDSTEVSQLQSLRESLLGVIDATIHLRIVCKPDPSAANNYSNAFNGAVLRAAGSLEPPTPMPMQRSSLPHTLYAPQLPQPMVNNPAPVRSSYHVTSLQTDPYGTMVDDQLHSGLRRSRDDMLATDMGSLPSFAMPTQTASLPSAYDAQPMPQTPLVDNDYPFAADDFLFPPNPPPSKRGRYEYF